MPNPTTTPEATRQAKAPKAFGAVLLATGLALAVPASPLGARPAAAAQAPCTSRDRVTEQLDKRFSEAPVSYGLASNGKLVEVFASDDGSTWTIVLTAPGGVSCIIAAGKYWENLPPAEELGPAA